MARPISRHSAQVNGVKVDYIYGNGCNVSKSCFDCPLEDCQAYHTHGSTFYVPEDVVARVKVEAK